MYSQKIHLDVAVQDGIGAYSVTVSVEFSVSIGVTLTVSGPIEVHCIQRKRDANANIHCEWALSTYWQICLHGSCWGNTEHL